MMAGNKLVTDLMLLSFDNNVKYSTSKICNSGNLKHKNTSSSILESCLSVNDIHSHQPQRNPLQICQGADYQMSARASPELRALLLGDLPLCLGE